ncbi:MAG: hypothetical protein JWO91_2365 [Acidobacteriaceae bacterium]|jgi:hypothetical protein|nr:hypothetical protein [Acidobacteriaceae bacterium]
MNLNRSQVVLCFALLPLLFAAALAQVNPSQPSAPVSYSSANQLNQLLSQLEQTSQSTQLDLAKMRIERWKTDSNTKRQTQANVESIQRNLQTALPDVIGQLRNSPENLALSFKLYRNLDALYDVFGSVVESAGAFGSKDDFQSLSNDFDNVERTRRSFADRVETLASAKEGELGQLRTEVHNMQAAANAAPPKKVVVDDTEPAKKTTPKKKAAAKKPSTTTTNGTPAPANSNTTTKP